MDRDNFFDNLRREDTAQDELRRQQRQLDYEERVIKRVVAECGIKITGWGLMANACRRETGQNKLNFAWFNQTFRGFPGRLHGRRVPRLHELDFQALFRPHDKNRLVKAVTKSLATDAVNGTDNRWIFVFPVVRTFYCAHNLDYNVSGPSFQLRDEDGRLEIATCPTKHLFKTIGPDWFSL